MKQLFFLLLIISLNTFSQSIDLGKKEDIMKTHFVEENKELYVFYKDSISVIDIINFKKIKNYKTSLPIISGGVEIVSSNKNIYFIENQGGRVFKLIGDKIERIDNSYTHKMQWGSSLFVYKDNIYRYGGYGFWSTRNFFTYFDLTTHEWEIVSPIGSTELPNGSLFSTIKIIGDDFYVYGGIALNPFEPKENIMNNEVWKFDFIKKSWNFLGKSKFNIGEPKFNYDENVFSISYGDKQIIFKGEVELHVIDVVNNKISIFKKTSLQGKINALNKLFFYEGFFYCLINISSQGTIQLVTRNEDEFFGELISEHALYETYDNWFLIGFIFISTILLLLLFLKIKQQKIKKNRINISNNNLIYKNIIHPFDTKEIQVLKLLLKTDDLVQSSQIMDIVENKTLHYAHNIKVKNHLMENLNFKLKTLLRIEKDIITSKKSKEDKRIKIYYIDKSYFYVK
ncbi:MAG: hypothetical protein NDI80_07020 [Flavobacteriaceae bacterium]|nr:hypothetical protein [Flavobacteriaceae bacterium]